MEEIQRYGWDPWVGKIPWNRKRQPTAEFLPGKFHGQRSLEDTVHGISKSQIGLRDWACMQDSSRHRVVNMQVAQSCPTLCAPMDCIAHGLLQARILEWVAVPFPRGSSQPRDRTRVSYIAGRFFSKWAIREAQAQCNLSVKSNEWMNAWTPSKLKQQ